VGNGLSAGTLAFYTIGVFGPEIGREFHWSAGQITGGLLVNSVVLLFTLPIVGGLSDRYGVRRVALCSTLLVLPCYISFALSGGSLLRYYLSWGLIGLLCAGTFPPTWSRAINSRFQIHKGLALGISLCGTGISGALLKPFSFMLVAKWGWRAGYLAVGCLPLLSFLVALLFLYEVPKNPGTDASARASEAARGPTLAEATRQWRFWVLAVAVGAAALGVGGPIPSIESVLRELSLSREQIITVASFVGLSIITGRLCSSYLIDRIWAPLVAIVMVIAACGAMLALCWGHPAFSSVTIYVTLIGATTGMEVDLAPFLIARYFGGRHYASIYGAIYGVFGICTGLGALLFGVAHDHMHLYTLVLPLFAGVLLLSGVLLLLLGSYTYPSGRHPRSERAAAAVQAASKA
jgi:predicted MFS family arabinose efflux permease